MSAASKFSSCYGGKKEMTESLFPDWAENHAQTPWRGERDNDIGWQGYKTKRKPNQNPTVMNSIISKSSMCPYILEGCIVNLWNCYIGEKLTEKENLAAFA